MIYFILALILVGAVVAGCVYLYMKREKEQWEGGAAKPKKVVFSSDEISALSDHSDELEYFLTGGAYRGVKKVFLPAQGGRAEIDRVVFSHFGIFVVLIYKKTGHITGAPDHIAWIETELGAPDEKPVEKRFSNPLLQNRKNITALRALTRLPSNAFHPVVLFYGGAQLEDSMPSNIMHAHSFPAYIISKTEKILTDEQLNHAVPLIMELSGKDA